jgi:hypothetical protein
MVGVEPLGSGGGHLGDLGVGDQAGGARAEFVDPLRSLAAGITGAAEPPFWQESAERHDRS